MIERTLLTGIVFALAALCQVAPPFDARLTVHTIVREDLFAGFLTNDMDRLQRGERNIELLLEQRPEAKGNLLAWKGGASLYRAVLAHERGQAREFEAMFKRAKELFAEASQAVPSSLGVPAVTGASYLLFIDRLPEAHKAAASAAAYDTYRQLWKQQGTVVDKMPLHHKGELLAGMAQSAQRTGRSAEATEYLDRIISSLPDTPYESRARKWKQDPQLAGRTNLVCVTCHDDGRLEPRLAALAAQPTRSK